MPHPSQKEAFSNSFSDFGPVISGVRVESSPWKDGRTTGKVLILDDTKIPKLGFFLVLLQHRAVSLDDTRLIGSSAS